MKIFFLLKTSAVFRSIAHATTDSRTSSSYTVDNLQYRADSFISTVFYFYPVVPKTHNYNDTNALDTFTASRESNAETIYQNRVHKLEFD